MRALLVTSLLAASSGAAADTPTPSTPPPAPGEKSERTAFILSAAGTAASSTMIIASFMFIPSTGDPNAPLLYAGFGTSLITPSLGQIYSGQYLTIGMGIRAISVGIAAYGASRKQDQPCDLDPQANCPTITGTGLTVISLAAIAYIGGIAYDVREAPNAARRANQRRAKRAASLVPSLRGVALVGYF